MAYLTCLASWPPRSPLEEGREPGEVGAVPQGAPEVTGALQGLGLRLPSLGREDPQEEGMATHSSILSWRIPWTEGPDGLQYMESQRVGHE